MAFTTTQLQALADAIASGELTVKCDGKEVTYRNMDDLLKAYDFVKGQLEVAGTIATSDRTSYAAFCKD